MSLIGADDLTAGLPAGLPAWAVTAAAAGVLLLVAADRVSEWLTKWRARKAAEKVAAEKAKADEAKAHVEAIDADSEAEVAEVRAKIAAVKSEGKLSRVWEEAYSSLVRQVKRMQELRADDHTRLRSVEIQLVQVTSGHQDCEKRAADQAAHIARQDAHIARQGDEIASLKAICGRQQVEIDAQRTAFKAAGLAVAPRPAATDDTGEHEPLPPV